ncbi:MobH family relaxase [Pseudomonas aeruginosa]|uniref:MobH family relaxase n=1 Tax=Pseudomonas aeruginosa TaxID=287 RepID=UPI000F7E6AD5|nr:MobH family relaxase [Pseudomonas aeruginosa]RTB44151.1 relaxase [Pseudomonas aeruginosa]
MFKLFQRKQRPTTPDTRLIPPSAGKGLLRPEPAATLLATSRRQKLLEHIWQRTSLSRKQFATLYLAPIERYAELVQQFPASESHHHSYQGGMLDHGLEIVAYALKLRQSHLLPVGSPPEVQAVQSEVWTAGIAYAALSHDIGKLAVDLHVEYADGRVWHPWHGPLKGQSYRFRYRKDREYRLHGAAAGLLYRHLLDGEILDWLSQYPELWASLLYVLAGQYEHAGLLGELVVQADQASVAQSLGGDPLKAAAAPKNALQRKLLDGLRYLLNEEFKLNQKGGPSDGWLTEDGLWLVSKTVSDKLRAHLLSHGIEGIPTNNTAVFNVLQDHGMLQPTPDGKAIWRATVTSENGWSHVFTLLRLAPALIWESNDRPEPFTGTVLVQADDSGQDAAAEPPSSPSDVTQTLLKEPFPSTVQPAVQAGADSVDALLGLFGMDAETPQEVGATDDVPLLEPARKLDTEPSAAISQNMPATEGLKGLASGEHFLAWLKHSIQRKTIIINDAKALVHTVADTAYLVTPGLFQRYAHEFPETAGFAKQENLADWQWAQRRFEKLRVHRKQPNGLNIWDCDVTGPRKSKPLHGYLLTDPSLLFGDVPPNNPYLAVRGTRES